MKVLKLLVGGIGMLYFTAYHNEQAEGILCTDLPYPRVRTRNKVLGLEGAVVWVVAGVGKSPKSYYLASTFIIEKCEPDKYPGDKLPHEVSGSGNLLGLRVRLDQTLIENLKLKTANFARGFSEMRDLTIVAALKSLAWPQ
jgi:hypothetical protein